MPSIDYDLGYLRAGLPVLEEYLLSKDIYWSLGGSPPRGEPEFPSLTLGGVLIAQARLHVRQLTTVQQDELARLDEQIDDLRARWRVVWERKASNEFRARLNLWRDFLEEFRQSPESHTDRYHYEVTRRVMLHLLGEDAGEIHPAESELLTALDKLLRSNLINGAFIWDAELEAGFPPGKYWYLYGQLKQA